MKWLKGLWVRINWVVKHKEASQRVAEAEKGLVSAKSQAHLVHHAIYKPGKVLREENNFANIIRGSLKIGHNGN